MRLRYRVLIVVLVALVYFFVETFLGLNAFAVVMLGAFCDNCTSAEADALQRPLVIWAWQFGVSLVVLVVAGGWWLFAPRRRAEVADTFR